MATRGGDPKSKTAVAADTNVQDEKRKKRLLRKDALEVIARKRKGEEFASANGVHDVKKKRKLVLKDERNKKGQDQKLGSERDERILRRERDAELLAWSNENKKLQRELDAALLAVEQNAAMEKKKATENAFLTEKNSEGLVEKLNVLTVSAVEEWRNKYHLERENVLIERKKREKATEQFNEMILVAVKGWKDKYHLECENALMEKKKASENFNNMMLVAVKEWKNKFHNEQANALTERNKAADNERKKEAQNASTLLEVEEWKAKFHLERESALTERNKAAENERKKEAQNASILLEVEEWKSKFHLECENAFLQRNKATENEREKEAQNASTLLEVEEWKSKFHLECENAIIQRNKAIENEREKEAQNASTLLEVEEWKSKFHLESENALRDRNKAIEHEKKKVAENTTALLEEVQEWKSKYSLQREIASSERKKAAENILEERKKALGNILEERKKAVENILEERNKATENALAERKRVEEKERMKEEESKATTHFAIEEWKNKFQKAEDNALRCELERNQWKHEADRAKQQLSEQKAILAKENETTLKVRGKLLATVKQRDHERDVATLHMTRQIHDQSRELVQERKTILELKNELDAVKLKQRKVAAKFEEALATVKQSQERDHERDAATLQMTGQIHDQNRQLVEERKTNLELRNELEALQLNQRKVAAKFEEALATVKQRQERDHERDVATLQMTGQIHDQNRQLVEVRKTNLELRNELEAFKLNHRNLAAKFEEALCRICLDSPRDAIVFPCRHSDFCSACLTQHRKHSETCPTCQEAINAVLQRNRE